jgi:hypothetical protein
MDTTEYGISEGSSPALESITACFFMSGSEAQNPRSTLLSYAAAGSNNGNEFMLWMAPDLVLWIKSDFYRYDIN